MKDETVAPPLLPCPFCGGKAAVVSLGCNSVRGTVYVISCTTEDCIANCARIVLELVSYSHKKDAGEAWNKRADVVKARLPEEIKDMLENLEAYETSKEYYVEKSGCFSLDGLELPFDAYESSDVPGAISALRWVLRQVKKE
jgi:hypothetical protein